MRRIIERVVTVVTTTTWKISWEADPPQPDSEVDPAPLQLSQPEISQRTPLVSTSIEEKEVDVSVRKVRKGTKGE